MRKILNLAGFALAGMIVTAQPANALFCSDDGARFNEWKAAFQKEYAGKFSKSTMKKFAGVQYSKTVIRFDRTNHKSFSGTFEKFYARRTKGMVGAARKRLRIYKKYFDKAEKQFGVPRELIASIWGLETAFGTYKGKQLPILQSVATLAYDCRRSESLFFKEFLAAMTITDKRMINLAKATGAWAGEIGQTQLLPSRYLAAATDYDGRGVNVFVSQPDVIGTTAKWFAISGWKRGEGYGEGTANFEIIKQWNRATLYQKTIPRLAHEIAGKKG